MAKREFTKPYLGTVRGTFYAVDAGTELEIPDEDADAIEADQPGTFAAPNAKPEPEAEPDGRAVEKPPADRAVKKAEKR